MRRAQAGDAAAYARVLRALLPTLRGRVRRRIYDEALVDDVIQDTLLTVHRLRHTYDPGLPMMPWINAIVAARSIDALRKRGRAQGREVFDDEAMAQAVDSASTRAADRLGVDQEVSRLLAFLPERQRAVVEAVKLREMSLDEAASLNRTSVSAIKALLHRAFETLRKHKSSQIEDHDHG
jgi:RNA polymerase sigma-70 factor (ECF subfamily)